MNCEKYSEWIPLYIDGELEDTNHIVFENHISDCDSCREEVRILEDITNSIKALEAIEPPEGFHKELMERIRREYEQNQQKVMPLPTKKNKWYLNLKIASAVAAVFIFSAVLLNPPKTNTPIESLQESEDNRLQSRMMDAPAESFDDAEIQGATFSMEEISLNTNLETWLIETQRYTEYKEKIKNISHEMGLEVIVVEELGAEQLNTQNITMEITLQDNQKSELESTIRSVDETVNIVVEEDIQVKKEQDNNGSVTLTIIINQIN